MNSMSVIPLAGKSVVPFDARQTHVKLAHLEGDLVRFRRLRDWPELERAVDAIMAEQASFVANWDATVKSAGAQSIVALGGQLTVGEAVGWWGFSKQAVSRWRASLKEPESYRARLIVGSHRIANLEPADNYRAGTGDNEWFTPPEHIALARSVLGEIDLDPASNPVAQQTVQAARYYTRDDDALTKSWEGRVWLNPPFSQPLIGWFVEKLVDEFASGRATQAILLTNNCTDAGWFHVAAEAASLICFPRGRIRFGNVDGSTGSPVQGQAAFYYGQRDEEFRKVYAAFGLVVRRA